MQITLWKKHDKCQVIVYQLLYIWIKCIMFCKHVLPYFSTSQNSNFLGTHPKIEVCAWVKTAWVPTFWTKSERIENLLFSSHIIMIWDFSFLWFLMGGNHSLDRRLNLKQKTKHPLKLSLRNHILSIFVEVMLCMWEALKKLRYINACFSLKLDCEDVLE